MRSYRRPALLVFGLIALVGIVVGLLWATNVFGWRAYRLVDVESFIGAKLPATAEQTHFFSNKQFGRIVWLRFDLPAGDSTALDNFLAEAGLPTLREGYTPFPAANPQEASLSWWTPYESQSYSGLHRNSGNKTLEVLATGSTVYLRAYTNSAR